MLLVGAGTLLSVVSPAVAQDSAERRLVAKYSPVVMLREQRDPPCDNKEEQYLPTTVDVVLGNPQVKLTGPRGNKRPPKRAPTAADIAGLGQAWYLNLPGNPPAPGCTYARDFASIKKNQRPPALTYAHIARQADQPGLALQYWFFYYFNQFNDLHEADWEGMQILFDSSSAEGALAEEPSAIGLFQHEGGESADWDDEKVEKKGNHPVVYPAAGSHATFYESSVFLENGRRGSGLGCDDTSEPVSEVRLRHGLVPTRPPPGSRYQWITYRGHWGQRQPGFNNGPQGPIEKLQWVQPFEKQDQMRSTSAQLPSGSLLGPTVTSAFCVTVEQLSAFLNLATDSPPGAIAVALAAIALVVVPASRTRWRPVELIPLRRPRAIGQLLRAARRLYTRHWRVLIALGLTSLVIVGFFEGLRRLAEALLGEGSLDLVSSSSSGQGLSGSIVGIGSQVGLAVVSGAIVTFMLELERGRTLGVVESYRELGPRFWRAVLVHLLVRLFLGLLVITVIGIPYAIKKFVDWQFAQQEVVFEDRSLREALHGSRRVVRGHWWHAGVGVGVLFLLGFVAGPMLGFALVFTSLSPEAINLFGSLVYALVVPYVAVGLTLLYLDLRARQGAG